MWEKIARLILKNRSVLLGLLILATATIGYQAKYVQLSYVFAKVIPADHPIYVQNQEFKKMFGEDGNVLTLGVQSQNVFELNFFNNWRKVGDEIKQIEGIEEVVSLGHLFNLERNDSLRKFQFNPLIKEDPKTQAELDSLRGIIESLPFYNGLIYNPETNASVMAVTFDPAVLNSKGRNKVIDEIIRITNEFGERHNVQVRRSGLPFIRTVVSTQIKEEINLFVILSMLFTAIILFLLFRSLYMVIFPMIVVIFGVIWSLGLVGFLGYKITLLTGLIPPLIIVIGIPNCIYLLNRYHSEFNKHGNKIKALSRVIEKVGIATFFTNLTTAIGFGVFYFTKSSILNEFGLVAGVSIMNTFVISLIFIPIVFSFLPKPNTRQTKYLDNKMMDNFISIIAKRVLKAKAIVFSVTAIALTVAIIGIVNMRSEGFIVDDIPHDSQEYKDLKFFEEHFIGIMPLEILVDTKKKGKAAKIATMRKLSKAQELLAEYPEFASSLSLADGLKFVTQAYYRGAESKYRLPSNYEQSFIFRYLKNGESESGEGSLIDNFIDSTQQTARISLRVKDIGSQKLPVLIDSVQSKMYSIFDSSRYNIAFTGTSITFLAGSEYLIKSLVQSLILAFLLIAVIMVILFKSVRMLFVCLIPNTIPLIITAGIMGYFNIALKPSTVLVFSVAYGIAVDTSIHFLAKFQQELSRHNWDTTRTIEVALKETGRSMIYNSLILFFGFIIFAGSSFGGTVALGILTSITLITAMFTNTMLLPSLLLLIENSIRKKGDK